MKIALNRIISSTLILAALLGAPIVHAQWLVHDEEVYKILDHLDDQLSMKRGGVLGSVTPGPTVKDSGDGITLDFTFGAKQSLASQLMSTATSAVWSALGLANNGKFSTVRTDTQELLDFTAGRDSYDSNVLKAAAKAAASGTSTESMLSAVGLGTAAYSNAASRYYGAGLDGLSPNCNDSAATHKFGKLMYENCVKARNVLAAQLDQIHDISKVLDERNDTLQKMLESSRVDSAHELQLRQYKLAALQTLIANDQMRLQAALSGYQALRQLYDEKRAEAQQAMTTGKSGNLLQDLISGAVAYGGMQAGVSAGKTVAETLVGKSQTSKIFDRAVYDSTKTRANNAFGQQ